MAKPLSRVITDLPAAFVGKGPSHVGRVGARYVRGRLPEELWADLCRYPMGEADDVIELFEAGSVTVEYDGEKSLPQQLNAYNREIHSPEGAVYVFEDCSIFGRRPVVRAGGKYFSASWFGVDMPFFDQKFKPVKRNLPLLENIHQTQGNRSPDQKIASGFLLLTERGVGFHHWFYEVLPKLWWYEKLQEQTEFAPKLIVHSPLDDYQLRSLELLGYDTDDVIQHCHQHSAVERLFLAPHPIRLKSNQLHSLPVQLKWVGQQLKSGIEATGAPFSERVYVSRADADRRHVTNEESVIQRLSERGFERYEPGRYSLDEQIHLFANAEIIVGPHGLAYTNLIYAEDATLVELFPRDGATETYFVATAELDLDYEYLECPTTDAGVHIRPRDRDLTVPVAELVGVVDEYI